MQIRLIAVGKLKETFYKAGVAEYLKRLSSYVRVEISEIPDQPAPDNLAPAQVEVVKEKEGQRLMAKVKEGSFLVALAMDGKMLSSEELAAWLEQKALSGQSDITFIIGGSHGLSLQVLDQAKFRLSLSPMTFPHQMARLILLEQLYRAFKISRNEPYHK
ncbi:MAG: 23S rRNA (pseudouridine(1915)-N(3))-methyltransferase RlmH [Bacillota bacterium]